MKELIGKEENIFCLDGDVVEIEGVKFGGAMGWYDYAHVQEYFPTTTKQDLNTQWKDCNNDNRYIYSNILNHFEDMNSIEKPKLDKVFDKCDITVTHINPSYKNEHIFDGYIGDKINSFFTSNGHKYLINGSMKYWIFGHTHDMIDYEFEGVKCICNPFGYPSENDYGNWVEIKTIEIDKISNDIICL